MNDEGWMPLKHTTLVTCPKCKGSGDVPGNETETVPPKKCPFCGGTGKVRGPAPKQEDA